MKIMNGISVFQMACKLSGKWGMYVCFEGHETMSPDFRKNLIEAAPYLKDQHKIISDERGFLFFDSEEEMNISFNQTVGDDGPTKFNDYNGPVRVYALTCSSSGELLSENT